MPLDMKITVKSKKLISILIPKIGGIIIHRVKIGRIINGYIWALGIRRKIWTGIIR